MLSLLLFSIISKCYLALSDNPLACVLYKDKNCATYKYEPSCGSNGITYSNVCFFSKQECVHPSIYIVHKGPCDATTTEEPTTRAFQTFGCRIYKDRDCTKEPVRQSCGNDGVTYDNVCFFGQKECVDPKLQVDHEGPCTTQVPSTIGNEPIGCRIYKNRQCAGESARTTCGTDGVTYLNACYFGQAECSNPSLKIQHLGRCMTTTAPPTTAETTSTASPTTATTLPPVTETTMLPSVAKTTLRFTTETTSVPSVAETTMLSSNTTTASIPSQTETASIPSQTETASIPSQTETASIPSNTGTTSIPSNTAAASSPSTIKTASIPSNIDTASIPQNTETASWSTTAAITPYQLSTQAVRNTETTIGSMKTSSTAGSTLEISTIGLTSSSSAPDTTLTIPTTPSTTTTTTLSFLCQAMMTAVCPAVLSMQCGNDNKTYQNPCEVTKAKCVKPGLVMSYDGPCVSTQVDCTADVTVVLAVTCPDVEDPFCGTDGNTYVNICQFRKAKCFLSTLDIAYVGRCKV